MTATNERRARGWSGVASRVWATARVAAVACLLPGCDECSTDADCKDGQVCEAVPAADGANVSNQCVTGCHADSQCGDGERCEAVVCVTAPCPGQCTGGANECSGDSDCGTGAVCELSTGCEAPSICVPGCHDDSQCAAGELCNIVQCITCPCPGSCEPASGGCNSDLDCDAGFVCELSTGCEQPMQCVPGCHADTACPDGQRCQQPQCLTCPCPGFCSE